MKDTVAGLGSFFVYSIITLLSYLNFCKKILLKAVRFRMFNPAILLVTLRQIYFTGVQIIPVFFAISLVMGIALVGFLTSFLAELGAYEQIGQVLTLMIIRELAPLVTVLLISLRSATAVASEISVMNIMGELESLIVFNIDPVDYLYLPRIIAGIFSMMCLAVIFAFISIIGGYFLLSFQMSITFDFLLTLIFDYLSFSDILCFVYKTFFLGFFVMSIPIFTSMNVKNANTEIPVSLLKGMMRLFYAIVFIELTGFFI